MDDIFVKSNTSDKKSIYSEKSEFKHTTESKRLNTDEEIDVLLAQLTYDDIDDLRVMLESSINRLKFVEAERDKYIKKSIALEKALKIQNQEIEKLKNEIAGNAQSLNNII